MSKLLKVSSAPAVALLPFLALAQALKSGTLDGIAGGLLSVLNSIIIPLMIAIAVIIFFYGVVKYVLATGDDAARAQARSLMIYGVVGLFVMVSIWGLVGLLQGTFGIGGGGVIDAPQVS